MGKGSWELRVESSPERVVDLAKYRGREIVNAHGERKNRVQSFIEEAIESGFVSSIAITTTVISIPKPVSCHFSHIFIPFISLL